MPFSPDALAAALAAEQGFTADLAEAWSHAVDAEMTARLAGIDMKALSIRQRIRTAVLTRLEILTPDKAAARRAALYLALPTSLPLALRLTWRTADRMWIAAGDAAADFNWYTKRASLAAVYAATEVAWFGDDTPDVSKTKGFLDGRIENVMQYERFKARMRSACRPKGTASP